MKQISSFSKLLTLIFTVAMTFQHACAQSINGQSNASQNGTTDSGQYVFLPSGSHDKSATGSAVSGTSQNFKDFTTSSEGLYYLQADGSSSAWTGAGHIGISAKATANPFFYIVDHGIIKILHPQMTSLQEHASACKRMQAHICKTISELSQRACLPGH